jgi:nitrate/TMAO reductase-like tetraheme cytochrome c subunit
MTSQLMPGGTAQTLVMWGLVVALGVALLALMGFRSLAATPWGRVALLVAAALLPVSVSVAGLSGGVAESSRTRFCLGCHEMQNHGRSLFVENRRALAAVHYQNRFVDRDTACYACHTDYAMFGDVKAKLNGLRHVYVHYLGTVPDRFALYQPYSNKNCLHCHEDARRFTELPVHQPLLAKMASGETSCLGCHNVAHDMEKVQGGVLWQRK